MKNINPAVLVSIMGGGVSPSPLLTDLIEYWALDEANGNPRVGKILGLSLAENGTGGVGLTNGWADFERDNSQFLNTADNANLSFGDEDFTISCQVNLESKPAASIMRIVAKANTGANSREYAIDYYQTAAVFTFYVWSDGTAGSVNSVPATNFGDPSLSTNYLIVAWHDSVNNVLGISVNNTSESTVAHSAGVYDGTADFCIGAIANPTHFFDGLVGNVHIWNRVLSSAERTALYNGGTPIFYPFDSAVPLGLTSPTGYQVFQRDGSDQGSITITGVVDGTHSIEASFNGGAYATIATNASGAFSGSLTGQSAGQGTLRVRLVDDTSKYLDVANIGIGDIFICAGQSNMSGRGANSQTYSHASLKAALYRNAYVWGNLVDPTDSKSGQLDSVSADSTAPTGSFLPLLATSVMASTGYPVAFVPCAMGGVDISDWQPGADHSDRATLYGSANYRTTQVEGARCVLLWEGENDVINGTAEATFNSSLDTFCNAVNSDQSIKVMVCKIQDLSAYLGGYDETNVNAAINTAWGDNANVLTGPDFSDLTPATTNGGDGLHFGKSTVDGDAELATVAGRWWTAIQTAFSWA